MWGRLYRKIYSKGVFSVYFWIYLIIIIVRVIVCIAIGFPFIDIWFVVLWSVCLICFLGREGRLLVGLLVEWFFLRIFIRGSLYFI